MYSSLLKIAFRFLLLTNNFNFNPDTQTTLILTPTHKQIKKKKEILNKKQQQQSLHSLL